MSETRTIARPYAEAVFKRACEAERLDAWAETLMLLQQVVQDPQMQDLVASHGLESQRLVDLIQSVCGDALDGEGTNLVRLLAQNGRLGLLADMAVLYQEAMTEHRKQIDVTVVSAYAVKPAGQKALQGALRKRLGREVNLSIQKDADLIAGVVIHAGDVVIDESLRGRLQRLAVELGA